MLVRASVFAAILIAAPGSASAQATVSEVLRIGGDDGPYLFADIRGVAPGANGSVLVLEFRSQEIRLFDSQGKFVKLVARRGKGPGEISNANGLVAAPNGEIWVNDPASARFSVFSPEGSFLRQHTLPINGFGYIWNGMIDTAGIVYDPVFVPSESGRKFRRFRASGRVIDTIPARTCEPRAVGDAPSFRARGKSHSGGMTIPFLPTPVLTWDRRGYSWCSSRDRYEVLQIRAVQGDTVRRVTLEAGTIPVSKPERDSAIARVRAFFKEMGAPEPDYGRIPNVKPAIETIDVDDRGRLWVRRSTSDSRRTTFDVWEERATRPNTVIAPWRLSPYFPPVFRGDTLLTVALDEDDVPSVVRGVVRT